MINSLRVRRMLLPCIAALLISSIVVAEGNADRGRELATDCAACHGADGNSPSPAFPILAGQHEQYLYEALKAYQSRSRNNAIMGATIIGKSDQQLKDLAAWYSSQRGLGGGTGDASGVAAAATASGALLAEGGSDLRTAVIGLPDESRCPRPANDKYPDLDSDGDGLVDAYDAAPDNADEFVLDTNNDGRFEICNIHQLQAIDTLGTGEGKATGLGGDERNERDYELVRSIDAAAISNFIPIGNCGPTGSCMNDLDKYGFKGSFDGRGHTISNLTISAPELGGVGLFGVISRGKVVRNIELVNAQVEGRGGTGTIVGSNFGTVYNCHSTGKVT
ncbi:MAG: cytochrome c, partial [Gammaproteobacteria bacterium]|nr:cytochrome c [Gammaproteobacteria bacterium]